uniref:Uncharacterized protein n=1 Tax=Meloidogyne enterolobii TaxID=390850 RepID=A0A6V7X5E8_MELEN|nr:unnamed protein product [Meloidogyne enterolobii]
MEKTITTKIFKILKSNNYYFMNQKNIIFNKKIEIHYLLKSFPSPNNIKTKYLLMQIPKYWNGDCGGLANQVFIF